jgi:hypothetical protein
MRPNLLALALLVTGFAVAAVADLAPEHRAKYLSECQAYASEDAVPEEELDLYLEQCVKDLAEADAEGAEEEGAQEAAPKD